MTQDEIQMAMENLFLGAERVRAKKNASKVSKNLHRQFSARILSQMWNDQKKNCKAA